jgi:hypothetical protein
MPGRQEYRVAAGYFASLCHGDSMTESSFRVTNPSEIERLTERLHDSWLDVESLIFDTASASIKVRCLTNLKPRSLVERIRFPARECFMKISNVSSVSVEDTQKIRYYDIDNLSYDHEGQYLEIKTGIPVRILIFVKSVDIVIEETGETAR